MTDQPLGPAPILPLAPDGPHSLGAWKARRQAARDTITRLKVDWDKNLDRLLVRKPLTANKDEVIVPVDYANVEQKKAQLIFAVPEIALEPAQPNPLGPQADDPVQVFEAVINHELTAPDGVNAAAMVDEVLSDALCPSGIFASKIYYDNVVAGTKQIQTGQQPDPTWQPPVQPGNVLNLGPTPAPPMVPIYATVPNIVSEHYGWDRLSPAKLLLPDEFTGSDYDRAPWLGMDFVMDFEPAKRKWNLPPDFASFVVQDDALLGRDKAQTTDGRGMPKRIKGSEIWYKASLFDPTVTNPDQLRVLVLIDGLDSPAEHRNSPYQKPQPDGSLIGMIGFPIHVGALRYVSDTAFPPSDSAMSKHQADELSKGRTAMIRQRERNIPLRVGKSSLGDEFFQKVEKNVWQAIIPLDDEHFADPNGPLKEIAQARFPRENFTFDQIAQRDIAVTWALDMNQRGISNETAQTATEVATVQANANIRLRKERNKFLAWFATGAGKLGALIQLFADQQAYVKILGPDGARRLVAWNKDTIQGSFLFKVKPNSAVYIDEADALSTALKQYNLLINSPFVNGLELTTALLRRMDLDPSRLAVQPQPKPAEVPKISFALNGNDLNPASPSFPIAMELLRQNGIQLDDQAIMQAQNAVERQGGVSAGAVAHGAPSPPMNGPQGGRVQPMNKHLHDESGQRSGPKPLQPGQVA